MFQTSDIVKKFALIVAGGKGLRMGSEIPKQFLELAGKPVLMRTIENFIEFDSSTELILVLPESQFGYWKELCINYSFNQNVKLVAGGDNRVESVSNGISAITEDGIVFIHDGVRPLVSHQTINNCLKVAMETGCAIPVIHLTDSIREVNDNVNKALNREQFRLVQTPQTFKVNLIKDAFRIAKNSQFTDDASIFEAAGNSIQLVDGNPENIKITRSIDMDIAKLLYQAGRR